MNLRHFSSLCVFDLIKYSCQYCCLSGPSIRLLAPLLTHSSLSHIVYNNSNLDFATGVPTLELATSRCPAPLHTHYLELLNQYDKNYWKLQRIFSYLTMGSTQLVGAAMAPENVWLRPCRYLMDMLRIILHLDFQLSRPMKFMNVWHLSISARAISASSFYCSSYYLFQAINIAYYLGSCFAHLRADLRCFSSSKLVTASFTQIVSPALEIY